MRTLYLRNVPDDVVARLEMLADRERMSLNAFAVRELTQTSARADNVRLLAELPVIEVERSDVLDVIDEGRSAR
jgi:plasmid stability protein